MVQDVKTVENFIKDLIYNDNAPGKQLDEILSKKSDIGLTPRPKSSGAKSSRPQGVFSEARLDRLQQSDLKSHKSKGTNDIVNVHDLLSRNDK